jgi:putative toxin-antitoxin system antitoxin component (TIGR02293 family)
MGLWDRFRARQLTPAEQLAGELEHPSATEIWKRALEVFGDEVKARGWMDAPRDIFDGRSPQDLVATGDAAEQRRVLEVLIRIDYGVFS